MQKESKCLSVILFILIKWVHSDLLHYRVHFVSKLHELCKAVIIRLHYVEKKLWSMETQ
jgi:hypothetical protein